MAKRAQQASRSGRAPVSSKAKSKSGAQTDASQRKTNRAELDEARAQQLAVAEVLKVISQSNFDLPLVLETLVRTAVRLCDADHGYLFRLQDGRHHLAASFGVEPQFKEFMIRNPFAVDRGTLSGRVALDRRVVLIEDAASDPGYTWTEAQKRGHLRTGLGVPLISEDTVIGIVVLYRSRVKRFTGSQIALVTTFADQAVIAIENTRLLNELRESLQQQTATAEVLKVISRSAFDLQAVFDTLISSAVELSGASGGTICLREGDSYRYLATSRMEDGFKRFLLDHPPTPGRASAAGRVILSGTIESIPDVLEDPDYVLPVYELNKTRSVVGVPLLRNDRVEGALVLNRAEPGLFTARQIELAQTFADQAVIAIENARLFDEVQARTRDLTESLQQQTATADVLKVISASPGELDPVFQAMLANAVRLCEAKFAMLFLYEEEKNEFRAVGKWNLPPAWSEFLGKTPLRADPGVPLGRVVITKAPVQVPDVLMDQGYIDRYPGMVAVADLGGARTLLQVPMLKENQLVGAFGIYRQEVRPFTDKQIALVRNFAAQAVIAIENARLLNELRQRTDDLTRSLEDLRTAQDRLVQTEKLASLGQLTAGIAHEIKNPLNFVNNFSALSAELVGEMNDVLAEATLDKKTRSELDELAQTLKTNLEKVVQHGKRADSIVKNMLLHSREGSGEHRPADINAIVDESLNLAYHGARAEKSGFDIAMRRDFDPAAGMTDVYPQEITRVLLNLISNGFYAATKRAKEAGDDFKPTLSAATKNLGDWVEIRIRDNGAGIPVEVREKIFNPFFTTKPAGEGTGLGLSMSHDIIVKQHGGSIDVETETGQFTEFKVVLPRNSRR